MVYFLFLGCLMKDKSNYKVLCLLICKYLILKTVPEAASEWLSSLSFVNFQCTCHTHSQLFSEIFFKSQAAFGTTFRLTGRYLKPGTGFFTGAQV
jgi:hypothetical protein